MTLPEILRAAEWVGVEDGVFKRVLHDVSYANSLKLNGKTLYLCNTPFAAPSTLGFYRDETFSVPGFRYGGSAVLLPKVGCRPTMQTLRCTVSGPATRYINRFSDGEVWVSTAANSRTGTKIAGSLAGSAWPRGVQYLFLLLCGGGGGGGSTGLVSSSAAGGGAGASAFCCVKLPSAGYATLTIGGGGAGASGDRNPGGAGGETSISCGDFLLICGGGSGGEAGKTGNTSGAAGGYIMVGAGYAGIELASVPGGSGGGTNSNGNGATLSLSRQAPEDSAISRSGSGGGSGSSQSGGGGGGSAFGNGGTGSKNAAGGSGAGYGSGGAGGGYKAANYIAGGSGTPGVAYIYY